MAALASTAVALISELLYGPNEWFTRGLDNRGVITRRLKLTLTAQGDQTDTIGAAALGFDKILECSNLFDDTNNKGYPAVVDPVTNTIILLDGAAAPAPVAVTSSAAYITVTGTVKQPSAT